MRLEDLEKYVAVGAPWPSAPPIEAPEPLCARCGQRNASVTLCELCFLEVAESMNRRAPEPEIPPPKPAQRKSAVVGWLGILLLALTALALGTTLVLFSFQH